MDCSFLNKKLSESQRCEYPWTHWQIDNFLPKAIFEKTQKSLCFPQGEFRKRPDDEADINYMFVPDLELAKFFLDDDFKKFLEALTGEQLSIHENSLVQLRKMDANSPSFPIHIDSQDERSLVCLLYVSPEWQSGFGGELCLFTEEQPSPHCPPKKTIAPIANRMVLFFSDDTHWHGVNKVSNWIRYSVISEWICES